MPANPNVSPPAVAPMLTWDPKRQPVSPRHLFPPEVKLLPLCVCRPPMYKRTRYPKIKAQLLTCCSQEVEAWGSGPTSLSSQFLLTVQVVVRFKRVRPSKLELWGLEVLKRF